VKQADRLQSSCLVVLAVVAAAIALIYTKTIMIPFVLSVFIAFCVSPVIGFFQTKGKCPRGVAIALTALLTLGMALILSLVISGTIKDTFASIDEYKARIIFLTNQIMGHLDSFNVVTSKEQVVSSLKTLPLFDYLKGTASKLMSMMFDSILIVIFVCFLLSGAAGQQRQKGTGVWGEIDRKIRAYVLTKTICSFATGALTFISLGIIGLDMAIMFGILAFLLNFIPTLGSLVAILLPLPIAIVQFPEMWKWGYVLALPGLFQFAIGNVIEPKVMGDSLDLHPITVLMSLMFWGLIWGIPGMVLAAPITVVIKLILSRTESGQPFADLLAGRMDKLAR
jgi:AI-2 transport protein TqsA